MLNLKVIQARKSKLIQKSGFNNFDVCLNTYVGCQFGCSYCYVRFFVKDKESAWGDFVRVRGFVKNQLPKELPLLAGKRLVLGTMTDPFQPQERKHRITRTALEIIANAPDKLKPNKIGIFTWSPIILDDIDLIATLPRAEVHMSITPYPRELQRKIESIPISNEARYKAAENLVKVGVRVCISLAPAIPHISDSETEYHARRISEIGASEFFVDPMQAYKESYEQLRTALKDDPIWEKVDATMTNKVEYQKWKDRYQKSWKVIWEPYSKSEILAIWCDHVNHIWQTLENGTKLDPHRYGSDQV